MKIAIIGAGKVGSTLAAHLLAEGNDITVVDTSDRVLTEIGNSMDVICYHGNGAACSTLIEADVSKSDLLIATTASDEINILCCLTAHKLGVENTVARVRNPEYYEKSRFLEEMGLSLVINPERAAAQEIARILRFPSATQVEMFVGGKAELVAHRIKADNPIVGIALRDLPKKVGIRVLICAVERDGDVLIPSGDFVPQADDVLYIIGAPSEMVNTFKKINLSTARARSVMIVGGSRLSFYLAEALSKDGVSVKIIERDSARAEELSRQLSSASVLVGDMSSHDLLLEEGLKRMDAFVSLTGLDEANILASLYAARNNVRKVITKVNNGNLATLVHDQALETVISPKTIIVNRISRYVRTLIAGSACGNVRGLYKIIGSRAEVLEFRALAQAAYLNRPFRDLPIKKNILIACLVRDGRVIIPNGNDAIQPEDGVLVVTSDRQLRALEDIME